MSESCELIVGTLVKEECWHVCIALRVENEQRMSIVLTLSDVDRLIDELARVRERLRRRLQ
jgi:hypothetical protein